LSFSEQGHHIHVPARIYIPKYSRVNRIVKHKGQKNQQPSRRRELNRRTLAFPQVNLMEDSKQNRSSRVAASRARRSTHLIRNKMHGEREIQKGRRWAHIVPLPGLVHQRCLAAGAAGDSAGVRPVHPRAALASQQPAARSRARIRAWLPESSLPRSYSVR
jgi:hypothetical protein